jgi:hypothetical protein
MRSPGIKVLAVIATSTACAVVRAQEWPRYHVGVAVGTSHLSPDSWSSAGVPEHIQPNDSPEASPTGWKVVAGLRPTRFIGAELQYVDFGTATTRSNTPGNQVLRRGRFMRNHADATIVSALLFFPERKSADFYGKVGVAKVEESLRVSVYEYFFCGPPGPNCQFFSDVTETDSRPYFGIGVRFKVARAWSGRVEYEAIDGDVGDDTKMFSVGVAWDH